MAKNKDYIELQRRINKLEETVNKLILLLYGMTTPRKEGDSKC